jgi:hypothetical protein
MSVLPLSLRSQRLSHCCKHLSKCRFVSLSSRACFSAWISAISFRLCPFNWVFVFWNRKTFEAKFLSCLAWSCRYLRTESLVFFFVVLQQRGTNFAAVRIMFKSSFQIRLQVPCDRFRMLHTSLIYVFRLQGWLEAFFLHFLDDRRPERSKISTEVPSVWNVSGQRFVLLSWCHHEISFKEFYKSQKLFWRS